MGRPATGAPRWNAAQGYWEARVSIPGQERKPIPMRGIPKCASPEPSSPTTCACENCARARRVAKLMSDKARREGRVPEQSGETWNEWHPRYLDVHDRLGKLTHGMKSAGETWIGSRFGTTPMGATTREQIVAIRDAMTKAVLEKKISAKRAMNLWSGLVVAPFSRAFSDDDPRYSSVRVGPASANPTINIKPPVTKEDLDEDRRERQPLYPHEWLRMLHSPDVPLDAKRIYALALYLYPRPQEFYALRWTDVDWEAREVRVRRKLDVRTGEEKPGTKSDAGIREIPIHENLLPLLHAMHEEAKHEEREDGRIVPLIGSARAFERFADQTRRHLKLAGIERRELTEGTDDHMPFDFRSWRTTGCTWLAMLGTDSYVIAQQAGHKSPETTWANYIKRGPDLRQRHGEPFPPLPPELLEVRAGFGLVLDRGPKSPDVSAVDLRRGRDSKPLESTAVPLRQIASYSEETGPFVIPRNGRDSTVLGETQRPEPESSGKTEALKAAVRAALDDNDHDLAEVLLTQLRRLCAPAPSAPVIALADRRKRS